MKWNAAMLLMTLLPFGSFAVADESSHRQAAEELLLLAETDKLLRSVWGQLETMMEQQFTRMGAPEEARSILSKYTTKMLALVERELSWEKMKADYIQIYVNTYTEAEIRSISAFYRTPAGRKFIEKMPQLMQESMGMVQKSMPMLMKEMQQINADMSAEIDRAMEKK